MGEKATATAGQKYVVQRYVAVTDDSGAVTDEMWIDFATVTVPARTHRTTVVEKAFMEEPELAPAPGEQVLVRVLDADSAKVLPVSLFQPQLPPRLVIGDGA